MRLLTILALNAALVAGAALAKPALRDVPEIDDALLAVGIADEIRQKCNGIDARMFRALSYLSSLKNKARGMGYSDEEIEQYVTSKAEKARMRARGEAWLAARGVNGSRESYCALGREEIARGSAIGVLLRAK